MTHFLWKLVIFGKSQLKWFFGSWIFDWTLLKRHTSIDLGSVSHSMILSFQNDHFWCRLSSWKAWTLWSHICIYFRELSFQLFRVVHVYIVDFDVIRAEREIFITIVSNINYFRWLSLILVFQSNLLINIINWRMSFVSIHWNSLFNN